MQHGVTTLAALAALTIAATERPAAAQNGEWGTVKGQVVFTGPSPTMKNVDVTKDQQHCLMKGAIPDETWVINPKNKGVRWTFVWIQPEKGGPALKVHPKRAKPEADKVFMDQPCCKFEPHVLGMREGQTLIVKNSAPIAHNVNYQAIRNPSNNVLVPAGGQHEVPPLKADRLATLVKCDIHPWMRAYVRIFNHPYFAVTDENGVYEIKDAPAGKYRLITWHETGWGQGGAEGVEVVIKGGAATEQKLELKESK